MFLSRHEDTARADFDRPLGGTCSSQTRSRAAAKRPRRQPDERSQELEHTVDDNPDEAEWKQEKPDDRVEQERQKGQRPAHHEQKHPQQKLHHTDIYEGRPVMVPSLSRNFV